MDETEQELEAAYAEARRKLKEYRDANRSAVLADVRLKIVKYGITKQEVADAHDEEEEASATRKPRTSHAPALNADGTVRKKRGRRSKAEIEAARAAEAAAQQE